MVKRLRLNDKTVREQIPEEDRDYQVFDTEIRTDAAIEEAPTRGQSVLEYAPDSQGAKEYRALVDEVRDRLERYGSVYGTVKKKQAKRS